MGGLQNSSIKDGALILSTSTYTENKNSIGDKGAKKISTLDTLSIRILKLCNS